MSFHPITWIKERASSLWGWWRRKWSDVVLAIVLAFVALGVEKAVNAILSQYTTFLESHPWLKVLLEWATLVTPWLVGIVFFILYLKWKRKALSPATTPLLGAPNQTVVDELEFARGELVQAREELAQVRDENAILTESLTSKSHEFESIQSALSHMGKWDGIEQATGLDGYLRTLVNSGYHPNELLDKIEKGLDFMGHGAIKWTRDKARLSQMLKNIEFNNKLGKARFLVINPLLPKLVKDDRKPNVAASLRTLHELKAVHRNLEVRVYNHLPQLRLTFFEGDLCVVGHYQGKNQQDSVDTPLLIFLRKCDWSFYKAFEEHFDSEWNKAKDIETLDMNAIALWASKA